MTLEEQEERITRQAAEFDAVEELCKQWRRLQMTPIVDDDYVSVRFDYERALEAFLAAVKNNRKVSAPQDPRS